jgi:hypothetical protein
MALPAFLENIPKVNRNILIINVIVFVATLINQDFMYGTFAMFYPASPLFRWWQPISIEPLASMVMVKNDLNNTLL